MSTLLFGWVIPMALVLQRDGTMTSAEGAYEFIGSRECIPNYNRPVEVCANFREMIALDYSSIFYILCLTKK